MELYPAFLNVTDRRCLVVGAGPVGQRKARGLSQSGAHVHLVAPDAKPDTNTFDDSNTIERISRRPYLEDDINECWLVVAATSDRDLNQKIASDCEQRRIFCNVVDDTATCSFIVPSVIDRSPLLVAITSGGTSPILARVLKTRLESLIPSAYARLAEVVGRYRSIVKEKIPKQTNRAAFWHDIIDGPIAELAFSPDQEALDRAVANAAQNAGTDEADSGRHGHVALVGAGPGDPDLLTFRALRLIQSADVIVHDRLVSAAILKLARHDAELIYAGKARSQHTLPQQSINTLLVDIARTGKTVVRLKGGDPFIFGRGGEEMEELVGTGIPFQVVPGITAASGCAAFSGIPLTHRDHAQSCVFVTGHLRNGEINMNWQDLTDPSQTIVVYMGLVGLSTICARLIEVGRRADTPAALIEHGTTPTQRVLTADLGTLAEVVKDADVSAPTLLIIGDVVKLRETLNWFKTASDDDPS